MLKPCGVFVERRQIILHQRSKSNHNLGSGLVERQQLFYIKDRNQTTTPTRIAYSPPNYFTSKIEIKPQLHSIESYASANYFTSKIEIKPQPLRLTHSSCSYYFTSKIEIKPQLSRSELYSSYDYFTSKIEIKPQL